MCFWDFHVSNPLESLLVPISWAGTGWSQVGVAWILVGGPLSFIDLVLRNARRGPRYRRGQTESRSGVSHFTGSLQRLAYIMDVKGAIRGLSANSAWVIFLFKGFVFRLPPLLFLSQERYLSKP